MQQDILTHLSRLVSFDTQNPPRRVRHDHMIFDYLRDTFTVAGGFSFELTDYGDGHINIVARRGQPKLLFNVHLDTVPIGTGWSHSPFELVVTSDRAIGRGTCDIKGAAAILLSIAQNTSIPMAVLFTTDEEGANGCCVKNFCSSLSSSNDHYGKLHYDMVVVAEPTQCEAILAHRGYLSMRGHFRGKSGHSSEARALTDNAIHAACLWTNAAVALASEEDERGSRLCFNVGTIGGGSAGNVIPDQAQVHWSARVPPKVDSEKVLNNLCSAGGPAVNVTWEQRFKGDTLPAYGVNDKKALDFCQRRNLKIGEPVDFWTEAALFSAADQAAFVLGPGNIEQAHTTDEWIKLDQLWSAADIYMRLLQENQ